MSETSDPSAELPVTGTASSAVAFRSLRDVIENIDTIDQRLVLYAARPWSAQSPIWATHLDDVDDKPDGFEYKLEVDLAIEAIEVWSAWRDDRAPTVDEACGAVIWYAEHDAYQPVEESGQDPDYFRNDLDTADLDEGNNRR